jgi:predicted nucleic acid-binding protein
MVVVADTSPINYLILIAQIDLLKHLYTRILIPPAVLTELKHPVAPKPVRDWADNAPEADISRARVDRSEHGMVK